MNITYNYIYTITCISRKYTGEACLPCGAAADFKKMHLKVWSV